MFGKTTEYAVRALVYIYLQNTGGNRPGFREIAHQVDAPEEFTGKVVQKLVRAQVIASVKGPHGGFYFPDMATTPSLLDVVRIIEGEGFFTKCGFGLSACSAANPCPIHHQFSPVRDNLKKIVSDNDIRKLALRIKKHKAVLNRNQF